MIKAFLYVKYSEASFPMSSQYTLLLIITLGIWILLWFGYRNNKLNDENKEREKRKRIKAKTDQRKKLERLYPENISKKNI